MALTQTELNFDLGAKVGAGGEGEVFRATDTQLNATIAVKRIPISNFTDPNAYYDECRKLYLTRHPNVVQVQYACKDNDYIYLSMPYYKNGSLKELSDLRFLTSREVIRYSIHFLAGLHNIHSKGLIHFDIKIENLMLSDADVAMVSDFGLAQYTNSYGFSRHFGTTPAFVPPELFVQAMHNLKFDIYQAGLAMYRLCNGDIDFGRQVVSARLVRGVDSDANFEAAVRGGRFPNRSSFLPPIPNSLRRVIRKAIEVDPNDRYSTVLEILNDLGKITTANDWQFSQTHGFQQWVDVDRRVTAQLTAAGWDIEASKNGRKKTALCATRLNEAAKTALLYKCLNENW